MLPFYFLQLQYRFLPDSNPAGNIRKTIAFSLLLLACIFPSQAPAISFKNFDSKLTLTPGDGGFFALSSGMLVKMAPRLVVKAAAGVNKNQLLSIDSRIIDVTELYPLADGCYYRVDLEIPFDFDAVIDIFSRSPLIVSVQPDLLQIRNRAGQKNQDNKAVDPILLLGIDSLWKTSRGRGVRIAVIDDGFDLGHEDFSGLKLLFSYDLASHTLDPSPRVPIDRHGTEVAGIIFAQHNGIGIDGIAPEAELIAIRDPDSWTSDTLLEFNLARLAGADVINCSWNSNLVLEPIVEVIRDLATRGRGGKGIALIFAAGNDGKLLAASESLAGLPEVIAVGADDSSGRSLQYSNRGDWVDIATYGSNISTTVPGPNKYGPFSGTSASAAIVSGVSALLLAADPNIDLACLNQQLKQFFSAR